MLMARELDVRKPEQETFLTLDNSPYFVGRDREAFLPILPKIFGKDLKKALF